MKQIIIARKKMPERKMVIELHIYNHAYKKMK